MSEGEITALLREWGAGRKDAAGALFPLVYRELHRLAHRQLGGDGRDRTLDTTALLHETYLKLVDHTELSVRDRGHFFALAARAMRQIVIDYARRRAAVKRGAGAVGVELSDRTLAVDARAVELLALDIALERLARIEPRFAQVVEMRFFGGLSVAETAESLEISATTVKRDWFKARAWLHRELARDAPPQAQA